MFLPCSRSVPYKTFKSFPMVKNTLSNNVEKITVKSHVFPSCKIFHGAIARALFLAADSPNWA